MGGYAYAGNNPVTHSDPSGNMLYDDVTGKGFGNGKAITSYYKKNKKQVKKILANQNRSWKVYYHSDYYKKQSSPAYVKAYTKYLKALYDAMSRANYPPKPKPKPKPHKSFWGKVGHGIATGAKATGHALKTAGKAVAKGVQAWGSGEVMSYVEHMIAPLIIAGLTIAITATIVTAGCAATGVVLCVAAALYGGALAAGGGYASYESAKALWPGGEHGHE
jgi:hypothetical protein